MTPQAAAPAAPAVDPKAAAAPPAGAPPAAKAEEATETIKVNGKEMKVTPSQLRALAQKGAFADQKLKSVDVLQGTTKRLIDDLKTPEGLVRILKDKTLGANPKDVIRGLLKSDFIDEELKEDIAKWTYENYVKPGQMKPEEIEREKKLAEYERLKAAEEKRASEEATKAQQAQMQALYQAVRSEITKQIVADKTFPQTEGSIRAVTEKLRVMNKKGEKITEASIGKAIGLVKKDHLIHQQAMFDLIEDPEALIAFFGEARALKISKALVARLQNKAKADAKAATKAPEGESAEGKSTDRIDKKFGKEKHGYQVMEV